MSKRVDTKLWVSTVFLSARNIDSVYTQLLIKITNLLHTDCERLYKAGALRTYVHETMAHVWFKNADFFLKYEPQVCIMLLNEMIVRKISDEIVRQYKDVHRVGLSTFPDHYVETSKQNLYSNTMSLSTKASIPLRSLIKPRYKKSTQICTLPSCEASTEEPPITEPSITEPSIMEPSIIEDDPLKKNIEPEEEFGTTTELNETTETEANDDLVNEEETKMTIDVPKRCFSAIDPD